MAAKRITVKVEGSAFFGHDLLPDVVRQMNAMVALLTDLADDPKHTKVEVLSLSKNSPLVAEVRVVHIQDRPSSNDNDATKKPFIKAINKPASRLTKAFDTAIGTGPRPKKIDTEGLLALEDFAKRLKDDTAIITIDGVERRIDDRLLGQIEKRLGSLTRSFGSVTGVLESLNIHAKKGYWHFDVYPTIGPRKIRCSFPRELLGEVKRNVGHMVRVTGQKHYLQESMWPLRVRVESIEEIPEAEPGSWISLADELGELYRSASQDDLDDLFGRAA